MHDKLSEMYQRYETKDAYSEFAIKTKMSIVNLLSKLAICSSVDGCKLAEESYIAEV